MLIVPIFAKYQICSIEPSDKKFKIQLITFKLKLLLPFSFVTTSVVASWMTLAASKGV